MSRRYWEIDCLRAIAILAMVFFHTMWNLNHFGIHSTEFAFGLWWWFARATAGTFIFVVGISMTLNYSRSTQFKRFALRGLKIFTYGLAITLITWLFFRDEYIIFGILHFIGLAVILGYFFLKFHWLNLALGIACTAIGIYLYDTGFGFSYMMWLGFKPVNYMSMDYVPLLPWFGVVLLGIFTGQLLYPQGQRRFKIPQRNDPVTRTFVFLGKHSLLIYLIHQPIVLALILAIYHNSIDISIF